MSTLLSILIDNIVPVLLALAALVGGLFAHKAGRDAERIKRLKEEKRAREIADEQDDMIDAMPSDEAREELKRHWTRK